MKYVPKEMRIREWIVKRYEEGYTPDKIREVLVSYGYEPQKAAFEVRDALGAMDDAELQDIRFKNLVRDAKDEIRKYDIVAHFQKAEYVLKNPLNFIKAMREGEAGAPSRAGIFALLNICLFSFLKAAVDYVFGGSLPFFVVNVVYLIILCSVSFAVFGYVIYRIIHFLGGRGNLFDTLEVFAYSSSVLIFAPLPYLWIVPALYGYALMAFNLSVVHNTKRMNAVIALSAPTIVVMITGLVLYALVLEG